MFGLVVDPGLGELVLLLEVDLSLFCVMVGMFDNRVWEGRQEAGDG